MPTMQERIASIFQRVKGGQRIRTPEELGFNRAATYQAFLPYATNAYADGDRVYKAVIPQWFYKPPWGLPISKDVVEIRRLAASPYVTIVRNTVANEISGMDWGLEIEEGATVPPEVLLEIKKFLYNPNRNDESLGYIIKQLVGDSIEIDGAVLEKVHTLKGDLVEIYARDAGLFTKNPDIHGVLPQLNAYWQYSWTVGTPPIPFNREDLVYMIRNPRTDTVYGRGEIETLYAVLRLLIYGVENNLEYYTETQTAQGVMKLAGATPEEIERFRIQFNETMRKADGGGHWFRRQHKMPIVNNDVEFVKTGFSSEELQDIEKQQWFTKLVWACFGMSPSEVGFTEDVNRATAIAESSSVKRKILKPMMMMLEYYFDTQVINALPCVKGKYEDLIHFEFDRTDLGFEKAERDVLWGDYDRGLITLNQFLEKVGLPAVANGDVRKGDASAGMNFGQNVGNTQVTGPDDLNLGLIGTTKIDLRTHPHTLDLGEDGSKTVQEYDQENKKDVEEKADELFVLFEQADGDISVFRLLAKQKGLPDWAVEDFIGRYRDKHSSPEGKSIYSTTQEFKALDTTTPLTIKQFEELQKHLTKVDFDFDKVLKKILGEGDKTEGKAEPMDFLKKVMSVDLSAFAQTMNNAIHSAFNKGLDLAGQQTKQNFVANPNTVKFLQQYSFDNIKGMEGEFRNDLRHMIMEGYTQNKTPEQLQEQIRGVFDTTKSRAKMIAVTEINRAINAGKIQGFRESGVKGKVEWKAQPGVEPNHPCYYLNGMTRLPGKLFQVKGFTGIQPPVHPNCLCQLEFVPEE